MCAKKRHAKISDARGETIHLSNICDHFARFCRYPGFCASSCLYQRPIASICPAVSFVAAMGRVSAIPLRCPGFPASGQINDYPCRQVRRPFSWATGRSGQRRSRCPGGGSRNPFFALGAGGVHGDVGSEGICASRTRDICARVSEARRDVARAVLSGLRVSVFQNDRYCNQSVFIFNDSSQVDILLD